MPDDAAEAFNQAIYDELYPVVEEVMGDPYVYKDVISIVELKQHTEFFYPYFEVFYASAATGEQMPDPECGRHVSEPEELTVMDAFSYVLTWNGYIESCCHVPMVVIPDVSCTEFHHAMYDQPRIGNVFSIVGRIWRKSHLCSNFFMKYPIL